MELSKKILFVANVDWFFISHRLILAEEAIQAGYSVAVACKDTGRAEEIKGKGIAFINFEFDRSGTNPITELLTVLRFVKLYKSIAPSLVHHITLKPVIYGSLATRFLNIPTLNAVSGLGYNFTEDKKGLSTKLMIALMRWGFGNAKMRCIFQNHDDKQVVIDRGILKDAAIVTMIKGAGVDLMRFKPTEEAFGGFLKVLLPARLLFDKGVREFCEAAVILQNEFEGNVLFQLVGPADIDNKAGISEEKLKSLIIPGYLEWYGHQSDMVPFYQASTIVVLPSYREGMPKTLLEACASGKPIVTTDAIGCRECVDEGVNGLKVPVKNSELLADAIRKLLLNPALRHKMGLAGRVKAENEFDVRQVIARHLKLYKELKALHE